VNFGPANSEMTTDSELIYRPAMRFSPTILLPCLGVLALASVASAQTAPLSAAELRQAAKVDSLTIPTPGEFLSALSRVATPNGRDE